ncbi:hypothetical protein NB063_15450 [Rhodopirellula sp. ICT_H3.1]|uniref:Secreted protein n=2 Tax=Aporhodopirellula aestuarii TaxID=2950107 RepID=A0ABT0U567_9BACT|nr:hypothetical protein [Aporhodopirellula aestuarii]
MRRNPPLFASAPAATPGGVRTTAIIAIATIAMLISTESIFAQGMALPPSSVSRSQPPSTQPQGGQGGFMPRAADTPPSLQAVPNQNTGVGGPGGQLSSGGQLPRGAGQEHRVYDLRSYTGYLTSHDRPHQAVVDWIVRETGTDVWHTEPFGFMSADRDELTVYHTNEMHQVIAGIVDRFVAGDKDPQVMNLKVMTVGNPNWRSRAHALMQHVNVQSPGIQAWLLTKENAALVMNLLRQRTDVRQVQAVDLIMYNGQTEKLASTRGRNYVINVKPSPAGWPPYEPETGEIQEGYQLELSPLLSVDGRTLDCVINANIDQVDKFVPVELDLPLPNQQVHRTKIEVPQLVSWRLHERFRWPSDMVLLLSCGVVASPDRTQSAVPFLDFGAITGTTAGRADALMFVEFRGKASQNLTQVPVAPQISSRVSAPNRGRY